MTLTGAGGSGKTRLAIEVATRLAEQFANGACFVGLAPVSEPGGVAPAIARALGVTERVDVPTAVVLKQFLAGKSLLLVLDNYEHVLDAAPAVSDLLMAAPKLAVLATSREALRLTGEHVYPVDPLPVPPAQRQLPLEGLADNPAVALFVERAQGARPRFALTEANAAPVADICRRVDGLPLAIELAAAQVRQYAPQALLEQMSARGAQGLAVLTGGARDLPARQKTLRATIDWSYRLLNPDEQCLLRWMGVFAGGAEYDQIRQIFHPSPSGGGSLRSQPRRAWVRESASTSISSSRSWIRTWCGRTPSRTARRATDCWNWCGSSCWSSWALAANWTRRSGGMLRYSRRWLSMRSSH